MGTPQENVQYDSISMHFYLPAGTTENLIFRFRAYKIYNGITYYSDYSDPYEVEVQRVYFDLDGGNVLGYGGTSGYIDFDSILSPAASVYIPGTKYLIMEPQKEGYEFIGWTGSNGNTPEKRVLIERDMDEPLYYTANWRKIED